MALQVLDMCCGTRAWWFQKRHPGTVFGDIRREVLELSGNGWKRTLRIQPDVQFDFRRLPFRDESFSVVVFDPPHIVRKPSKPGFIRSRYGQLSDNWKQDLREGFSEAFRVLRPMGSLCFKWAETEIALSEILPLAGQAPLVGQRRRATDSHTHYLLFMKEEGRA